MTNERTEPPDANSSGRRIASVVTLILGCALLTLVAMRSGANVEVLRIELLERPFATAERVFERDLELEDGLSRRSAWLQRVLAPAMGPAQNVREEAIAAWLDVESKKPRGTEPDRDRDRLMASRAVLCAEAGRLDEMPAELDLLRDHGHGAFVDALRVAYGPRTSAPNDDAAFELLGDGWCASLARERAALVRRDEERARTIVLEREARADLRAASLVRFAWIYVALFAAGLAFVLTWLARDRPAVVQSTAAIPPAWTFDAGVAVLVRAAFFGLVILYAGSWLDDAAGGAGFVLWGGVVASIPMFVLARRRLATPPAPDLASAFGLAHFARPHLWIALVLGTFAIEQLGARAIEATLALAGVAPHWTERVLESALTDGRFALAASALDLAAWTPFVEEVAFRGLLFLTLRRAQSPVVAALFSAALFGSLHVQSLPSLLAITWSGFVWALAVERSKSLMPGMACHALDNTFALAGSLLLYR